MIVIPAVLRDIVVAIVKTKPSSVQLAMVATLFQSACVEDLD